MAVTFFPCGEDWPRQGVGFIFTASMLIFRQRERAEDNLSAHANVDTALAKVFQRRPTIWVLNGWVCLNRLCGHYAFFTSHTSMRQGPVDKNYFPAFATLELCNA